MQPNLVTIIRATAISMICLLALIAAFIVVLAGTLLLTDDSRITANIKGSIAVGALIGDEYPLSPYGHFGLMSDMFSDCVAFGVDLANNDKSLIYRLAATPRLQSEQPEILGRLTPCADLVNAIWKGEAKATVPYFRFWHGYLAYTRPMLSMMPLPKVRRVNAILLYGALLLLAYRLSLWFGPWSFFGVLAPFAISADLLTMPLVTVHAVSFIWMFLSVAIVAIVLDRWGDRIDLIVPISVSVGAIFNFVSFLANPPLAPAFIGFLVIAKSLSSARTTDRIRQGIVNAGLVVAAWFAGFAIAWIAKWMLAASVVGIDEVIRNIIFQAAGDAYTTPKAMADANELHILTPMFVVFNKVSYFLPLVAASWGLAAVILGSSAVRGRLKLTDILDFLVLLLPLLVPWIWVELTPYHSIEHAGFVFRDFLVFEIFPILASLMIVRRAARRDDRLRPKLAGESDYGQRSW